MTWWKRLCRSNKLEQELERELQFHIAERISEWKNSGCSEETARQRVRQEFGGLEQVKETCRDARGTRWVEDLFRDFRFGLRMLIKYRTASVAAVVSLGLERFVDAPLQVRDASRGLDSLFRAQFRRPLWILTLVCLLLLLIACANVANLMLARASARDAEMALRISLGAAKSRLIQQILIEGSQVALVAGALGLFFAALATPMIVSYLGSTEFPAWLSVSPNHRTIAFAALLTLLTTLLFGLAPTLRASSVSPNASLKEAAAKQSTKLGLLRWTLTAQVCFSVGCVVPLRVAVTFSPQAAFCRSRFRSR